MECLTGKPVFVGLALGNDFVENNLIDHIDTVIDTNLKGVFYVTKFILGPMKARSSGGQIINIGSVAGIDGYPGGSIYCASKFGLAGFTECLRHECISYPNLRIAEIKPGLVETNFSKVRHRGNEEEAGKVYRGIQVMNGKDIADIAVFIATRPRHVQIADLVVYATCQSAVRSVHRES